jgi:hypothetical protein
MEHKKGQVQSIAPAILALVFAAIVLILGLVIVQSVRDTDVVKIVFSSSGVNESMTNSVSAGISATLGAAAYPGGICGALTEVLNGTVNHKVIALANFTQNGCTITNATATTAWTTTLLVSYPYTYADNAYTTANKSVVGLATFADFWEIIVLAIVISIVIGLLLIVFGRGGRR